MFRTAEVVVEFFPKEAGGRQGPPWLNGYRYSPHFRVTNSSEFLGIEFVSGPDQVEFNVQYHAIARFLYEPNVSYEALIEGTEFEILEGPKVVGKGKIISREELTS